MFIGFLWSYLTRVYNILGMCDPSSEHCSHANQINAKQRTAFYTNARREGHSSIVSRQSSIVSRQLSIVRSAVSAHRPCLSWSPSRVKRLKRALSVHRVPLVCSAMYWTWIRTDLDPCRFGLVQTWIRTDLDPYNRCIVACPIGIRLGPVLRKLKIWADDMDFF